MDLASHPNKEIVVGGGGNGWIQIWDTRLRKRINEFEAHENRQIFRIAMSPDGTRFVSATGDWSDKIPCEVKIWNSETFELETTFLAHETGVRTVALTPDSRMLVTGGNDETVNLWKSPSGEKVDHLQGPSSSSAVSSNGKLLAAGGGNSSVILWDLSTAARIAELQANSGTVDCLTFTPDDRTLIAGYGNGTIKLWNVETRREMITLDGHGSFLQEINLSPDGTTFVSTSNDKTVRLWPSLRYPPRNPQTND